MRLFAPIALAGLALSSAEQEQPPAAAAAAAEPSVPSAALQYVSPAALGAMKHFFHAHANPALWKDKNVLALVQGQTTTTAAAPPQTLAPFIPPFTPPTAATVTAWQDYNLNMMAFWYRFEFGFLIFKTLTKTDEPWLNAAIAYFDMLANGYIAANQFLSLYAAYEQVKLFDAADSKTYFPTYLAWVSIRQVHAFTYWLFNLNSKDLLAIQAAMGAEVDEKAVAWFDKATPFTQYWAFSTWMYSSHLQTVAKYWDGKAWDSAKTNSVLSLFYQSKFANTQLTIAMLGLSPADQPMAKFMQPLAPWLAFSLSYLPYFITGHNAAARAAAPAAAAAGPTALLVPKAAAAAKEVEAKEAAPAAKEAEVHPLAAAAKALEGKTEAPAVGGVAAARR